MRRNVKLVIGLALGAVLAALPLASLKAQERALPQSRAETLLSFSSVVKKVQPAVVNVYASRVERRPSNPLFDDPIFRRFFGDRAPGGGASQSLGSGVIVDSSGLIVTNYHVIDGMTEVKVALQDKREFEAEIALRDPRTDLAVLRVKNGGGLPAMELGDSDKLEVGDLVLAIGNPFGVGQTVTQGIVSALARTQIGISDYGFFIQTDAAINPGNSGGALVDLNARLVGVNSAIFSKSGGSVGIGFAIPVNMVKIVVATAKSGGAKVRRPWLGASLQSVSNEIAESMGLQRPSGALLANVAEGSPIAEAGLKRGDVIMGVDGQEVDDPEALGFRIGMKPIGGTAALQVVREGKKLNFSVKLEPAPETPPRAPITIKGASPFVGATVVNISPAVAEELSLNGPSSGVVIAEIAENSPAASVNLQKGDVIIAVNDAKIANTRDLEKAATARPYYWKLVINRGGEVLTTVLGG